MSTSKPRRKPGRPRDENLRARRREEILAAATRVFAARGYRQADVQEVADASGLGKGTVYRYFASKEALFLAAVDLGMQRLTEFVQQAYLVEDPFERMEAAFRNYLLYFREHLELVELLIQERAEFRDRKQPTYFVYKERGHEPWRALFAELIAAGRVRDLPVERILNVLGDFLYGTMFTNYFSGRDEAPEAQAAEAMAIVLEGLLSDGERRARAARRGSP
jgi:AcrR family transcriptional regulator